MFRRAPRVRNVFFTRGAGSHMQAWIDITVPELKCFLAICVYMGMNRKANRREYWDTRHGDMRVSGAMSRDRIEAIMAHLHVSDHEHEPKPMVGGVKNPDWTPLCKVDWLLKHLAAKFQRAYELGEWSVVDEMMIPCKNRVGIKQ